MATVTRRRALAALAPLLGAGAGSRLLSGEAAAQHPQVSDGHDTSGHANGHLEHAGFRRGGRVDHARNGFDPSAIVRDFDEGTTTRLASGRVLREWELVAVEKEIEVAPGVAFAAWTFNGRVPGPALRAREGDRLRIRFRNGTHHPHTIHFHGIHPSDMDGVPGPRARGLIEPGGTTIYEFDAEPFGLHLYHCHASPLAAHIAKGLYGAFIVDPSSRRARRRRARDGDERVRHELRPRERDLRGQQRSRSPTWTSRSRSRATRSCASTWSTCSSTTSINSFHLHGNFFDYFPTGTSLQPRELTDTVMPVPGPARDPRDALPAPRASSCSTPTSPSSPSSAGWASSTSATTAAAARLRPPGGAHGGPRRRRSRAPSLPAWLLGLVPLLLAVGVARRLRRARRRPGSAIAPGRPVEELAVERTVLDPGSIELTVRNDGPDAVTVAQVFVNDAYVDFDVARTRESTASRAETVQHRLPVDRGRGLRGRRC